MEVNTILVNTFPHIISEQAIEIRYDETGNYKYTIVLPNAVLLNWDGHKDVDIEVGLSFMNEVKGQWTEIVRDGFGVSDTTRAAQATEIG